MKYIIFIALLVSGCSRDPDMYFWYPVKLMDATCGTFTGEIYLMENSFGWRSWPYLLEKKTKLEIQLGTDCTFRTVKLLPVHKKVLRIYLTDEQVQYLVEGFR